MTLSKLRLGISLVLAGMVPGLAFAQFFEFQSNEVLLKYASDYEIPYTNGQEQEDGLIFTFQHADGWKYGDNFFFIDFSDKGQTLSDIYGEFYANFSLGKITGKDLSFWRIQDVGIIAGVNLGKETKIRKFLPGVRLSWDVPGFSFVNTDFTAYIDHNKGVANGGVPKETNSYMIDVNFLSDFDIGNHGFSFEGHIEYMDGRKNEFDEDVKSWLLAQPRLMYDLGRNWDRPGQFYVGIEWMLWINKTGDPETDENVPQLIFAGRF